MHTLPPDFPIALAREVFARLCTSLPPPRDGTPEARAVRDDLAYAAVEAYYPVDAGEAELAVQIVAANAHALDSLRLAGLPGKSEEDIRRCRAQGNSMMRTAQSALRALERRQASREKAQNAMHPAAMDAPATGSSPYQCQRRRRNRPRPRRPNRMAPWCREADQ